MRPAFADAVAAVQHYTETDVEHWLGAHTLAKGRGYLHRVTKLELGANSLSGLVKGSAPKAYRTAVYFGPDLIGGTRIASTCTCPMRSRCKHVAALLLKGLDERGGQPTINPAVLEWIEALRRAKSAIPKEHAPRKAGAALVYVLHWARYHGEYRVSFCKARLAADGTPTGRPEPWINLERALVQPPAFVNEEDLAILRLLWAQRPKGMPFIEDLPLAGRHGEEILRRMLDTERLHFGGADGIGLRPAESRPASIVWQVDESGRLKPAIVCQPPAEAILPVQPLWYVDTAHGQCGRATLPVADSEALRLLALPPLSPNEAPLVAAALAELAPDVPPPAREAVEAIEVIDQAPTPTLTVGTLPVHGFRPWRDYHSPYHQREFDYALVSFRYGPVVVAPGTDREFVTLADGRAVRVKRRRREEEHLLKSLGALGLKPVPNHLLYLAGQSPPKGLHGLASEGAWPEFLLQGVPRLEAAGWHVEVPAAFRHRLLEVEAWDGELAENESGWFDVDLGILVEGRRLALAPLLADLFRREPRWLDAGRLTRIADNEATELIAPDGSRICVTAGRLKPLARTLIDLFDDAAMGGAAGPLRLSRLDAPRLAALAEEGRWQFRGMEAVAQLAERLRGAAGVQPVAPPRGFALELREYQREGLAWLQYLREHELAGILADDMGLGKTAQTLAHLLAEKEAGRLDRPALVVLPTSLISNWAREAARFAPSLSVLALRGPARRALFADIPASDLVLTTYPLLWRDLDELARHAYHLLILDEAQTVKNAASRGAESVRQLKARHRLCLTGTPLENHLGELWSQFDFLLPGFLGDERSFARRWRTPIEKQGDQLRRELLAGRVRPFILRRRKEDVARELPPKTEIMRTVELEGSQRDLYETVRSAMDERVRQEIAAHGFKKSQIVILDALLKLRQVCCDPRLVKSEGARRVEASAKLALLMDMLPELVHEGRRMLIFSQFTSMLALIEQELVRARLGWVKLTGETRDRDAVIQKFQRGEAPVFLVSLKAGGVGLNLTQADTVIHYDPWWNPAVENQATDRAHRIGQTKRVFVYKLVVAGSIEEKIVALQERKAALAASILSGDRLGEAKFSEADLAALLARLPPLGARSSV